MQHNNFVSIQCKSLVISTKLKLLALKDEYNMDKMSI